MEVLVATLIVAIMVIIACVLQRRQRRKALPYTFYLHNCTNDKMIIISAHYFEREFNGVDRDIFIFYDGDDNIVFSSSYPWTNVYRGEEYLWK